MKIKRLVVKGFMRFRDQQEILFPENNITLVFGENGAGKTSLLDAICVSLYGRTFRTSPDSGRGFLNMAEMVNHDSSEASIHLEFENHGHNYVVKREVDKEKSDGELLEDGELKAQGDSVFEYASSKAIGLDWEGFSRSTVVLQGEMSALTDVLPATRKEAFMNLFGLAKYREYEKAVSEEIEDKNLSVKKMEASNEVLRNETAKIPQVASSLKRLKKTIAGLEQQRSSSAKKLGQVKSLMKKLEKDHRTYLVLNGKMDRIAADRKKAEKALEQRLKELQELNGLKKDFRRLKGSYREFETLTKTIKNLQKKKKSYDRIAGRISSLRELIREKKQKLSELNRDTGMSRTFLTRLKKEMPKEQAAAVREDMLGLKRRMAELEERRFKLEALLETAVESMGELKREMAMIRKRRVCPVCSQKIASPSGVLRHYQNEIRKIGSERRRKQKEVGGILLQLRRIGRSLRETEEAMSRIETAHGKRNELRNEMKKLDSLNQRRKKARQELGSTGGELASYQRQLRSLHFDAREYEAIERRLSALREAKIAERYSGVGVRLKRRPEVTGSIDKIKKSIADVELNRSRLLAKIKKFGDIERRFAAVKTELESARNLHGQNVLDLTKEKTNHDALTKQHDELKAKEKRLLQNEDKMEKLRDEVSSMDELEKIFRNIPERILHRLIPYIEKEGTMIINDLSDGVITALNIESDTLDIGAAMGSEIRPLRYFSGGQQTRINIALRTAISRLLSRFPPADDAFAAMQTLLVDEGDFGDLDETGVRDAMNVLQRMTKEFSRIILLSHLESVRENFRGYTVEVIKTAPFQSIVTAPAEEALGVKAEAL